MAHFDCIESNDKMINTHKGFLGSLERDFFLKQSVTYNTSKVHNGFANLRNIKVSDFQQHVI